MTILVIEGSAKSGTSLLANSVRDTAISSGRSALLIDDHADGEAMHHLEKIIQGDQFVPGTAANKVNWKKGPQVILVKSGAKRLKEFEEICPGFTAKFGPVSTVKMDAK